MNPVIERKILLAVLRVSDPSQPSVKPSRFVRWTLWPTVLFVFFEVLNLASNGHRMWLLGAASAIGGWFACWVYFERIAAKLWVVLKPFIDVQGIHARLRELKT